MLYMHRNADFSKSANIPYGPADGRPSKKFGKTRKSLTRITRKLEKGSQSEEVSLSDERIQDNRIRKLRQLAGVLQHPQRNGERTDYDELAELLIEALGGEHSEPFVETPFGTTPSTYISSANEGGLLGGLNQFDPDTPIIPEEVRLAIEEREIATMLATIKCLDAMGWR